MVTVYSVTTGQPVEVTHAVDARDYVLGGAYTYTKPVEKKPEPIPAPKATVEPKKEEPKVEPVKEAIVAETKDAAAEPIRKINPRLIRK